MSARERYTSGATRLSKKLVCRTAPCETCPYRRDVPSGIWSAQEYQKLPEYDRPTSWQPPRVFHCHTSPDFVCTGWAQVHGRNPARGYELLSLRIAACFGRVLEKIPRPAVPLFESGRAAAKHGMKCLNRPSRKAREAVAKILAARARKMKVNS